MKTFAIVLALGVLGAAAALAFIKYGSGASPTNPPASTSEATHAGHDHGPGSGDHHDHAAEAAGESLLHGAAAAPTGEPTCEKHRIPQRVDAFCNPDLVESLGYCGGHKVAEAFCTRCSPILIAAFKAEGDWCEEHALPESQCAECKGS